MPGTEYNVYCSLIGEELEQHSSYGRIGNSVYKVTTSGCFNCVGESAAYQRCGSPIPLVIRLSAYC